MIIDKLKYWLANGKGLQYIVWLILAVGVLLRITVYLQANSMYVDEANVARNVFERSYIQLTQPLNYYQYAPPVFLWIVKACTQIFGYSEYAYRIYPVICAVLTMLLMYVVLTYYTDCRGMWYALLLLAVGPLYVRYAQATKQYAPDMFFTLMLVWLALHYSVQKYSATILLCIWIIAGSIAIWASMPSVFILAGVGVYYFACMVKQKDYSKLWFLILSGLVWVGQFACYYLLILKPQANSEYLQNCHKDYFFYLPVNAEILKHDIKLIFHIVATAGGFLALPVIMHSLLIIIGVVYLLKINRPALLLLIVPVILLLIAAALHQYTLMQRVILFSMPLLLILIAVGMRQVLNTRYVPVVIVVLVLTVINVANFNVLKNFVVPMQQEEMKESLLYLKSQNIKGTQIYTHNLATPAYVYYTSIHPDRVNNTALLGATPLEWDTNMDSLAQTFPPRAAMLYSWDEPEMINGQQNAVRKYCTLTDSNIVQDGRVYIYTKK